MIFGQGEAPPKIVKAIMEKTSLILWTFLGLLVLWSIQVSASAETIDLFPKTPPSSSLFVLGYAANNDNAKRTILALQGMVNQTSAEIYIATRPADMEQLAFSKKNYTVLPSIFINNYCFF